MAFDPTKPTSGPGSASFNVQFGFVRENIDAMRRGDDNVFVNTGTMILRIRSTGTGTPAIFSAYSGNGTTSARASYVQVVANETSPQDWRFGMVGTKDYVVNNSTAGRTDLTITTAGLFGFGGAPDGIAGAGSAHIVVPVTTSTSRELRIGNQSGGNPFGLGVIGGFDSGGSGFGKISVYHSGEQGYIYLNQSGQVGIKCVPSVRLHVGTGGTGTQAEQVYVDSGSGVGGQPSYHLLRNSVLKATLGLAATTSSLISGSAINDLAIVNTQAILFSADSGTNKHVSFAASLYTFGKGGTGTQEEKLVIDSGSGSAGHAWIAFQRNSVEEGSIGIAGSAGAGITGSAVNDLWIRASSGSNVIMGKDSGAIDLMISSLRSVVLGSAALATTATDGFLYIATCAGTPTGVPTAFTGRVPMVFDTTGVKFWIYTGGAWKGVVVA